MPPPTGLSLVVPLYRDASTVEPLVQDAIESLAPLGLPYEIVLVDDGSPDDSGARARDAAARFAVVRALAHERNRGLAAALSTGILAARHSHVLYTDGDHSYPLSDAPRFVAALGSADVVVGIRPPGSRPWTRRVLTSLWSIAMRACFELALQDVNCSFKLFPRSVLDGRPLDSSHGFADAEILLRARERGLRLGEIPVTLRTGPSRPSNFLKPRLMAATAREAVVAWRERSRSRVGHPAASRDS